MNKKRKKRNRLYLWVAGTLSTILIGGVLYSGFAPAANLHATSVTSEDSSSQVAKDTEGELEDLNYPREDFDDLLSDSAYLADESDLLSETPRDVKTEEGRASSAPTSTTSLIGNPDPSWGKKLDQYYYWNKTHVLDGAGKGYPVIEFYDKGVVWIGPGELSSVSDENRLSIVLNNGTGGMEPRDVKYIVICDDNDKNGKIEIPGTGEYLFWGLDGLKKVKGLGNLKVNGKSSGKYMFARNKNFIGADFENLNISNFEKFEYTFADCPKFGTSENLSGDLFDTITGETSIQAIENWDVKNINSTLGMFNNCIKIEQIDLSKWNVQNITEWGSIFSGCEGLKQIIFPEINDNSFGRSSILDGCKSLYLVNLERVSLNLFQFFRYSNVPQYLILGKNTNISKSKLGEVPDPNISGWGRVESESNPIPTTPQVEFDSSAAFMSGYQGGTQAGTYTWQKVKPKKPATFEYSGDLIFQPTDLPFSSEDDEGQFISRADQSKFYFEVKDPDLIGWTVNMKIQKPFHEEEEGQTGPITQLSQALRYVKSRDDQITLDETPQKIISQTANFSTKDSWTPDTGVLMYLTNEQADSLAEKIKTENKDKPADPEGNNTITVSYSATIAIEFIPTQP